MRIDLSSPDINENDIASVTEVLRSGRLSLGPVLEEFEQRFAEYIGTQHAVAVSSGTAALHLCMVALDLHPGEEVITTPFSFVGITLAFWVVVTGLAASLVAGRGQLLTHWREKQS